jgi:hypothetical protein
MSKCFVRTRGDRTSGPAASTAMTGRPNGPQGPQGPKGRRVTHGYAGHRCDGRLPGLRRPQLSQWRRVGLIRPPHSDTRLARRIRRAWEGTLLIPTGGRGPGRWPAAGSGCSERPCGYFSSTLSDTAGSTRTRAVPPFCVDVAWILSRLVAIQIWEFCERCACRLKGGGRAAGLPADCARSRAFSGCSKRWT